MKINFWTCEPSSLTGTDERKGKSNFCMFLSLLSKMWLLNGWVSPEKKITWWGLCVERSSLKSGICRPCWKNTLCFQIPVQWKLGNRLGQVVSGFSILRAMAGTHIYPVYQGTHWKKKKSRANISERCQADKNGKLRLSSAEQLCQRSWQPELIRIVENTVTEFCINIYFCERMDNLVPTGWSQLT